MARRLRTIRPGSIVSITDRTLDDRFLMLPKGEHADAIKGVIESAFELAREKYGIALFSIVVMADHWHIELRAGKDPWSVSRFMQYVKSRVAAGINRILERSGPFWNERFHSTAVLDEDALVGGRLPYTLLNPVRAGLCERVEQYPGITSVEHSVGLRAACGPLAIGFALPDSWVGLDAHQLSARRAQLLEVLRAREADVRALRVIEGLAPASVERSIEGLSTNDRALAPKRSRQPWCFASCPNRADEYRREQREVARRHRISSTAYRGGQWDAPFPAWTFPPALLAPQVAAPP